MDLCPSGFAEKWTEKCQKTWVNQLTHTLTHNSLDSSGQGITNQHPAAHKSKNLWIFKFF